MIKVTQHIPGWVDTDKDPEVVICEEKDLYKVTFIKRWNRWGVTKFERDGRMLIAHLINGEFWVIAYIDEI